MNITSAALSLIFNVTSTKVKATGISTPIERLTLGRNFTFTHGTGIGQINYIWHDRRTVASAGIDTIDLTNLPVNSWGDAGANFTWVKALVLNNLGSADLSLQPLVGHLCMPFIYTPGVNLAWYLMPGIFIFLGSENGYPISPGDDEGFRVINTHGAPIDYEIAVAGLAT